MKTILSIAMLTVLIAWAFAPSPRVAGPPDPSEPCVREEKPEYLGVDSCKKCHFKQWMSWKKTKMAKSFDVLAAGQAKEAKKKHGLDPDKDYTTDGACLACHTTGYGKPGGYPAVGKEWSEAEKKRAKALQGVQCESCHGPGSLANPYKKDNEEYAKAEILKRGMVEPDAANCKTCHNEKSPTVSKDYKFDYDALIKDPTKIHKHSKLKFKH